MNWQIPILTEGENNNARIINMSVIKLMIIYQMEV